MPLILLLLPLAALALFMYSQGADAAIDPAAGGAYDPATDPSLGADVAPYAAGLFDSIGPSAMTNSIARGLRNNNPGNIRASSSYTWQGQTGSDGSFAIFDSAAAGIRAIGVTLKTYQSKYGLNTVQGIISRWAPSNENNTAAYVAAVARQVGVSPTQPIDVNNPDTLAALTAAIIQHENGSQPFDMATIATNVNT